LQSINTSFTSFSPFYKGVEEKGKKRQIKGKTMAQWMNLWNSSFVNYTQLPFLCEKSGTIALVLLGLMAGWLAGKLAGRRNSAKFKNFKIIYQMKYSSFCCV